MKQSPSNFLESRRKWTQNTCTFNFDIDFRRIL